MDGGNLQTCRSIISDSSASNKIWKKDSCLFTFDTNQFKNQNPTSPFFVIINGSKVFDEGLHNLLISTLGRNTQLSKGQTSKLDDQVIILYQKMHQTSNFNLFMNVVTIKLTGHAPTHQHCWTNRIIP